MERIIYEQMAELGDTHWWFVARRQILKSVLDKFVGKHAATLEILEIGCGAGHNMPMLSDFGRVEGLEVDQQSRDIARQRTGMKVSGTTLPQLDGIPRNHYDLIALLDVLEHIEDDRTSLESIFQCLKPDGCLLMTVPAYQWLWSAHDDLNHHKRRYTKRELVSLLRQTGFTVKFGSYFNSFLFPLIVIARAVGRLTGKETSDDSMPPGPVNGALRWIFGQERHLVGRVPLPAGVSILALAKRP